MGGDESCPTIVEVRSVGIKGSISHENISDWSDWSRWWSAWRDRHKVLESSLYLGLVWHPFLILLLRQSPDQVAKIPLIDSLWLSEHWSFCVVVVFVVVLVVVVVVVVVLCTPTDLLCCDFSSCYFFLFILTILLWLGFWRCWGLTFRDLSTAANSEQVSGEVTGMTPLCATSHVLGTKNVSWFASQNNLQYVVRTFLDDEVCVRCWLLQPNFIVYFPVEIARMMRFGCTSR